MLRLRNVKLIWCPKSKGIGNLRYLVVAQTEWQQITLDSIWCVLSVQYQTIRDGHCLDEMWGEEQIVFVFIDGLRSDTQEGAQKSLYDLYKWQEGENDGQNHILSWVRKMWVMNTLRGRIFELLLQDYTAQCDLFFYAVVNETFGIRVFRSMEVNEGNNFAYSVGIHLKNY